MTVATATSIARRLAHAIAWLLPVWAGRSRAETHGRSRWAKAGELAALRRERRGGDGRVVLGWHHDRLLFTPREDNLLLLGVQRSGKTSCVVVPTLLSWSGAVVATSTKEELVQLTARRRAGLGRVHVFAPLDSDTAWIDRLGLSPVTWNPVASAGDMAVAAQLADNFTAEGKRGPSAHWYLSASNLLTALFVCEHQHHGDMRSVLTRLNKTKVAEYVGLAEVVEDATAAELPLAIAHTPEREAGSIVSTARSSISLWIDNRVARATRPSARELDLDGLLENGDSLYLVAPAEEAERLRPLFSALLQTLLRYATARARDQGGVLAPRLLLALDEAANFTRIPRLAGYASSGPGQGIQLLLCFHDLAQVESAYGPEDARTIWNNCRARLLLPGQGDLRTLEAFSRAIGDETLVYRSRSSGDGRSSSSEQRVGRPLTSVDDLRRMKDAVLIYANAPPAQLQLRRWDQVPSWRELVID